MTWDKHEGSSHFSGSVPLDMNAPPAVGETAQLTKEGYEFDVEIKEISGTELSGVVTRIGPPSTLEAAGIKRGDTISFQTVHIHTLYQTRGDSILFSR